MDQSSHGSPKTYLDPHEVPPQELKALYKLWTGAISPVHRHNVNAAPCIISDSTSMPISLLVDVFTEFVVKYLSSQCPGVGNGLEDYKIMVPGKGPNEIPQLATLGPENPLRNYSQQIDTSPFDIEGDMRRIHTQRSILNFLQDRPLEPYNSNKIPGLTVLPRLFPPVVQQVLLDCLLHRDLSTPDNKTNIHLHYHVSYPENGESFFSTEPESCLFLPKDPNEHKRLTNRAVLEKSLRWITLGGQYNWTEKAYPSEMPPEFPEDIARLIRRLFSDMEPQAAIVNFYSARDKLSLHRDVSEEADRGLVSVSLGCSCIFIIGLQDKETGEIHHEVIHLNSGDVLYMSGESRYAWHGVPKIIPGTCPKYLEHWPGKRYPGWDGWMSKKRVNLNIRQMYEK